MDNFWSELLQQFLLLALPMVAVVAVSYAIKALTFVWTEFKFAQPDAASALESAARVAVQAAEQAGASEYIDNKKQYALEVAEGWLKLRGVKVDLHLLSAAIEAAVFDEFNRDRGKPKPATGFITDAVTSSGLNDDGPAE